jgi:hypothetical protein
MNAGDKPSQASWRRAPGIPEYRKCSKIGGPYRFLLRAPKTILDLFATPSSSHPDVTGCVTTAKLCLSLPPVSDVKTESRKKKKGSRDHLSRTQRKPRK